MTNYLAVLNAVLRRMREEPVDNSDDGEYSKLIRQFIDETKEDIESRWDWNRLRHSIIIDTEVGESRYVAHGVRDRARIIEAFDVTSKREISYGQWAVQNRLTLLQDQVVGQPSHIDRNGFDVVGDPIFEIYPIPDRVYRVVLNAVIPQDPYDSVDQDTSGVEIPFMPLVLGTYIRAIEERGDDTASRYEFNLKMYQDALHQAIAADEAQQADANIWRVE